MSTQQCSAQPTGTPAKKPARPATDSKSRREAPDRIATTKESLTVNLAAGVRQPGESVVAMQACNDYLLMGAGRGLARLQRFYLQWENQGKNLPETAKTSPDLPNNASFEGGNGRSDDDFSEDNAIPTVDQMFPRAPSQRRDDKELAPPVDPVIATPRVHSRPPTTSLPTIKEWSSKFNWAKRAEEFDAQSSQCQLAQHRQMMTEGFALAFNRVRMLEQMLRMAAAELLTQDNRGNYVNLWLRDVKMIGVGLEAYPVAVKRYNSALIGNVRGLMNDLAKETGGRQNGLDALIREIPWDRLPEQFANRVTSENPKEVIMDIVEEVCERTGDDLGTDRAVRESASSGQTAPLA